MPTVTQISRLVQCLQKVEKASELKSGEAIFDFCKKMTSGYGRDASSVVYKGKYLEELPEFIQNYVSLLKKPSVKVCGHSVSEGQGIFGLFVKDGNRTVSTAALSLDLRKGDPILQFRGSYGNGNSSAINISALLDTNIVGKMIERS